jgi:DNA-binding LytR/AlgR family response regulator
MNATALIAEDEPLLAAALQAELARAWPELRIVAQAGDGASAVREALALRPQVLFLDIRMPGLSGLEAAAELADEWPGIGPVGEPADPPFPAIVFVTAYDQYALQAFEAQAVDYLLKPVVPERLARCVQRLQQRLAERTPSQGAPDDATLQRLRALLAAPAAPAVAPLKVIQASVGSSIRLLPVDEVLAFEAADKYLRVLTADAGPQGELLIRTPLRELLPQLDASTFWQIHRGTVVRATAIHSVTRDEAGKLHLTLRGRPERWAVSRLYAPLFKAM